MLLRRMPLPSDPMLWVDKMPQIAIELGAPLGELQCVRNVLLVRTESGQP
ncbi:hypothetical protein FHS42_001281 [Streptomyces zagrosensis]|uniref:Uncharacterized protein n=1 Tax=Streptomyces zagrosensis TaxID=1042984 RepID=A0A7W9Q639_9ACTN|nr:hypothetical protein [Streptomyces zagrosensis]